MAAKARGYARPHAYGLLGAVIGTFFSVGPYYASPSLSGDLNRHSTRILRRACRFPRCDQLPVVSSSRLTTGFSCSLGAAGS
jgi:hypothetical protein